MDNAISKTDNRLSCLNFHSLCTHLKPLNNIGQLLHLGLSYVPQSKLRINSEVNFSIDYLRTSLCWKYIFRDKDDSEYDKKIYIATSNKPSPASPILESKINSIKK